MITNKEMADYLIKNGLGEVVVSEEVVKIWNKTSGYSARQRQIILDIHDILESDKMRITEAVEKDIEVAVNIENKGEDNGCNTPN